KAQLPSLAGWRKLKRFLETVFDIDRRSLRVGLIEYGDDLLEPIQAKRETHGGKVHAKGAGQTIISAAARNLEPEIAHIGAKKNATVIVEAADFAQIDRQVLRKIELLKSRVDFFKMIQGFDGSRILH